MTTRDFRQWLSRIQISGGVITALVLIIAVAALGLTGFYFVDATSQAVVTRFGKYSETVGPGLHFKIPFGIDRSYVVPIKVVQTEQFGFRTVQPGVANQYRNDITRESTMLTGDLNIVDVEWIIQYRIVDPTAWLFNVADREKTIRDISQSVVNMLVGDRAILDVMRLERGPIEVAAIEMMNDNFRQLGLGISVLTVQLQNIVPPAGVQAAFEDVNKSTQDMERLTNEGQEAYNAQIPRAQGEALRLIQQANGYATERINRARGDAARFNSVYEEYRRAPQITRERLYLETMETIFAANQGQVLLDGQLRNVLPIQNITSPSTGAVTGGAQ
ncbi:MAG: FtsH protease activity modulator HflK [Spirochaetaceae bacterium]|jgi:membrane protease subunit HflK|nr:FtsH protease activity modulator HflK [Spirochaetaceae bacterium]